MPSTTLNVSIFNSVVMSDLLVSRVQVVTCRWVSYGILKKELYCTAQRTNPVMTTVRATSSFPGGFNKGQQRWNPLARRSLILRHQVGFSSREVFARDRSIPMDQDHYFHNGIENTSA